MRVPQPGHWLVNVHPIATATNPRDRFVKAMDTDDVLDAWENLMGRSWSTRSWAMTRTSWSRRTGCTPVWSFGVDRIWLRTSRRDTTIRPAAAGDRVPLDLFQSYAGGLLGGSQFRLDEHEPWLRVERLADRYADLQAFHRNAGRPVFLCGNPLTPGSTWSTQSRQTSPDEAAGSSSR